MASWSWHVSTLNVSEESNSVFSDNELSQVYINNVYSLLCAVRVCAHRLATSRFRAKPRSLHPHFHYSSISFSCCKCQWCWHNAALGDGSWHITSPLTTSWHLQMWRTGYLAHTHAEDRLEPARERARTHTRTDIHTQQVHRTLANKLVVDLAIFLSFFLRYLYVNW